MHYQELDNRQLTCPQPVINTKKALEELLQEVEGSFTLKVLVDNETARENVARFAKKQGCEVDDGAEEDYYYVSIKGTAREASAAGQLEKTDLSNEELSCCGVGDTGGKILMITSSTLGEGDQELGNLLMRSFIFTLKDTGSLPSQMMFLNSGVYLTTEGSPVLEELQNLEEDGVKIVSCGTCLDYYNLKDKLRVGEVTNMYDTVENLFSSSRCITV